MTTGRIDTHQHILPGHYRDWLFANGYRAGRELPDWSLEKAIDAMGRFGIDTGIVSITRPGVYVGQREEARGMAQELNEFAASLANDHGSQFGFFATLTLPDVDGSLEAADHALGTLGADGVTLLANSDGQYIGEADVDPLMELLDERSAVAFIHPNKLPGPEVSNVPAFLADFLLDTTRAALSLIAAGVVERYPNIRFILSHAGGFIPYFAHRVARRMASISTERTGEEVLAQLRSFYYDTALSSSPTSLPSLLAFVEPTQILFGSDWPYPPDSLISWFVDEYETYPGLTPEARDLIDRANAERLFPRLAA